MLRRRLPILLTCALTLIAGSAGADQCDFDLEADLRIEPERVLIEDTRLGAVELGEAGALTIDGQTVVLDDRQRDAVRAYAEQMRTVVPAVVETALEGAEIGITAATEVLSAFLGDEIPASIREGMAEAREEVRSRIGRDDEVWFVYRGGISADGERDKTVDGPLDSIEPIIERVVTDSIGALLIAAGTSMQSGEGTFEERMTAFAERVENLDEEIETKVESRINGLEERADSLCAELQILALRERVMKRQVPALDTLRVLEAG